MAVKLSLAAGRILWSLALLAMLAATAQAVRPRVVYPGGDGPGKDKSIVLISGDEEYRSEESLPQLAKILSREHGFTCTVLFAIDPEAPGWVIDPNIRTNIPYLNWLDEHTDLMIIATRRRRFARRPDGIYRCVFEVGQAGPWDSNSHARVFAGGRFEVGPLRRHVQRR